MTGKPQPALSSVYRRAIANAVRATGSTRLHRVQAELLGQGVELSDTTVRKYLEETR